MATRNTLPALTIATVVAVVTGCGTSSTSHQGASDQPSSPPAAGAQAACADLGGSVDPHQICLVHVQTSSYTIDFSFPVSYPDRQPLTDFLTNERDQEVDYAEEDPPTNRPMPYELKATGTAYRSGPPASGTESLVFEVQDDTGVANVGRPTTSYQAFNYDLSKGAPITFDTLFKPGTKPLDVQRELAARGRATPPVDDLGADGYQNFALTDDAVIFFFGHDFLHEDGPREVSVPRTELAALLA
jgi:hypothetical protein